MSLYSGLKVVWPHVVSRSFTWKRIFSPSHLSSRPKINSENQTEEAMWSHLKRQQVMIPAVTWQPKRIITIRALNAETRLGERSPIWAKYQPCQEFGGCQKWVAVLQTCDSWSSFQNNPDSLTQSVFLFRMQLSQKTTIISHWNLIYHSAQSSRSNAIRKIQRNWQINITAAPVRKNAHLATRSPPHVTCSCPCRVMSKADTDRDNDELHTY